jgi:hypothetical protein
LLNLYIAFGVITVVVSAVTRAVVSAVGKTTGTVFDLIVCPELALGDTASVGGVDDALASTELESDGTDVPGLGLTGGKSNCEMAITTSERNRARKKRLSIQGTGS